MGEALSPLLGRRSVIPRRVFSAMDRVSLEHAGLLVREHRGLDRTETDLPLSERTEMGPRGIRLVSRQMGAGGRLEVEGSVLGLQRVPLAGAEEVGTKLQAAENSSDPDPSSTLLPGSKAILILPS